MQVLAEERSAARQDELVTPVAEQWALLGAKPCACPLERLR
jgi:hypothetical protein